MNIMAEMRNFKETARRLLEAGVYDSTLRGLLTDVIAEVGRERNDD